MNFRKNALLLFVLITFTLPLAVNTLAQNPPSDRRQNYVIRLPKPMVDDYDKYHDIGKFINSLERNSQILRVKSIDFLSSDSTEGRVVKLAIVAFSVQKELSF